jgi:hypothetical protein
MFQNDRGTLQVSIMRFLNTAARAYEAKDPGHGWEPEKAVHSEVWRTGKEMMMSRSHRKLLQYTDDCEYSGR